MHKILTKHGKAGLMALLLISLALITSESLAGSSPVAGVTTGGSGATFNFAPPATIAAGAATSAATQAAISSLQNAAANPDLPASAAAALAAVVAAVQGGNSAAILQAVTQSCQTLQTLLAGYTSMTPAQQQALVAAANAQIQLNVALSGGAS